MYFWWKRKQSPEVPHVFAAPWPSVKEGGSLIFLMPIDCGGNLLPAVYERVSSDPISGVTDGSVEECVDVVAVREGLKTYVLGRSR